MLATSARLLRLLSLLQSRRDWSGTELAARLEVTTRTVRTDIDRLRTLGYPVLATRGVAGGYRLGAGGVLPPLLLDDDEAVAVAVSLRTAATGSIAQIEESSARALAKLEQVLPTRLRRRISAVHTYVVAVHPTAGPTVSAEIVGTITTACRDRESLRFDYHAHDGTTSRRDVEPYRLVNWGRRWYLVAWDLQRRDWRTYRVDRIDPRTRTGARFAPRQLPADDLAAYVSRGASTAAWRHQAHLTVHAPAAVIAERLPTAAGTVEVIDEHTCAVHTGADSVETLGAWLGMLGADFDLARSGSSELAAQLQTIADRYLRAART